MWCLSHWKPASEGGELETSGIFELCRALPPLPTGLRTAVKSTVNPGTTMPGRVALIARIAITGRFRSRNPCLRGMRSLCANPERVVLESIRKAKAVLCRLYADADRLHARREAEWSSLLQTHILR
jgi:hypothetical protein